MMMGFVNVMQKMTACCFEAMSFNIPINRESGPSIVS